MRSKLRLFTWASCIGLVGGLLTTVAPVLGNSRATHAAVAESDECVNTSASGVISGVITDRSSGSEVPYTLGARIRLINLDDEVVVKCVISDGNGRYAIDTSKTGSGFLISVDPAPGAPSILGSSGGVLRLTSSSTTKNYSLGSATYQGVASYKGAFPNNTIVCLRSDMARLCGSVISRSDSEIPRFALYDQGLPSGISTIMARKKSDGVNLIGSLELSRLNNPSNTDIPLQQYSVAGTVTDGCVGGKTPNIFGRVTLGDTGYSTTVRLGQSWTVLSGNDAPSTISHPLTTVSSIDGTYQFCYEPTTSYGVSGTGMPAVLRTTATVANLGTTTGLGDTSSAWVGTNCLLTSMGCEMPTIEMKQKSLWGTVKFDSDGDAGTPDIPVANSQVVILQLSSPGVRWYALTDSLGRYSFADVPQTGNFYMWVNPLPTCDVSSTSCNAEADENNRALTTTSMLTMGGLPTEKNVVTNRANFRLSLLDPDGYQLSRNYSGSFVRIISTSESCRIDPTIMYSSQCRPSVSQKSYGSAPPAHVAKVEPGKYAVYASARGFATSVSNIEVAQSGAVSLLSGPIVTNGTNQFAQRLTEGNLKFQVTTGSGTFRVTPDSVEVQKFSSSSNSQPFLVSDSYGAIDSDGFVRWNALESGIYKFKFGVTSTSGELAGFVSTDATYEIEVANGVPSVLHSCTTDQFGMPTCQGSPPTMSGGFLEVFLNRANFEGELCDVAPVDSCASPSSFVPFVSLTPQSTTGSQTNSIRLTRTKFYFNMPYVETASGYNLHALRISLSNPGLYTNQVHILKVSSSGLISYCGPSEKFLNPNRCSDSTPLEIDPITNRSVLPRLRIHEGNVKGTVLAPGNSVTPVANAGVCFVEASSQNDYCDYQLTPYASRSLSNGEFAVDLLPGTYRVIASPSTSVVDNASDYSSGLATFTVGNDGQLQEPLVVRLTQPNIIGKVLAGTSVVAYPSVQVLRSSLNSSSGWEYAGFSVSTRSTGRYLVNLPQGTWRLLASSNGTYSANYASGLVDLVVGANGDVQTVDGAGYPGGEININFKIPNLKLALANTGVTGLGVNVRKWDNFQNFYRHLNENGYFNLSSTQSTSMLLSAGRYEVRLEPYNLPNFVGTSYYFKVDENGSVCTLARSSSTTCFRSLAANEAVALSLNGPNIKGSIRAGGVRTSGYIQVDRFNTVNQSFEWSSDIQGVSTDTLGGYSMRLPVGFYRITANPSQTTTGYTRGIDYVVVYEEDEKGATWCRPGGSNPAPCTEPLKGASDSFDINLQSANVKGAVKFRSALIQNSWVQVEKFTDNYYQWIPESSSVQQGRFAIKLDSAESPVKYRLIVNQPSPNTENLAKKKLILWVGDFVAGGADDDLCIQDELQSGVTTSERCLNPIESGSQFEIQMTQGNVVGIVKDPTGSAVESSNLEVRVWKNSYWNWTDNSSYTTSTGSYTLDLEIGVYQVTARAPNGTSTFTNSAPQLISVAADGSWCRVLSIDNTNCLSGTSSLEISLRSPNLSGTLKDGSTPISGVWMHAQKLQVSGGNSWWDWIDVNGMTSNTGQFAVNLSDDGEYRLEISTPYGASHLPRFYSYYVVRDGKICEGQGCTPTVSTLTSHQLMYPAPNFIGTVYSPTNQPVSNIWVDTEVWDASGNYWRWASLYANVGSNGSFAMLLPSDARYRLRINPPWNGAGYPRFTQIVEVDSSGKACAGQGCSGHVTTLSQDLRFPTANVVGSVVLKSDGLPSSISRWSWLYAYNQSSFEWANASASGEFSMYLADGEWTMWFFPDYSRSSAQPIQISAKIENGVLASWRYAVDPSNSNSCPSAGQCEIDVSFSYIPPNFRISVTDGGTSLSGAFVQLENVSTAETFDFTTDTNGTIEGLIPAGDYKVTALKVVGSAVTKVDGTISVGSSIAAGDISIVLAF